MKGKHNEINIMADKEKELNILRNNFLWNFYERRKASPNCPKTLTSLIFTK